MRDNDGTFTHARRRFLYRTATPLLTVATREKWTEDVHEVYTHS